MGRQGAAADLALPSATCEARGESETDTARVSLHPMDSSAEIGSEPRFFVPAMLV